MRGTPALFAALRITSSIFCSLISRWLIPSMTARASSGRAETSAGPPTRASSTISVADDSSSFFPSSGQ